MCIYNIYIYIYIHIYICICTNIHPTHDQLNATSRVSELVSEWVRTHPWRKQWRKHHLHPITAILYQQWLVLIYFELLRGSASPQFNSFWKPSQHGAQRRKWHILCQSMLHPFVFVCPFGAGATCRSACDSYEHTCNTYQECWIVQVSCNFLYTVVAPICVCLPVRGWCDM